MDDGVVERVDKIWESLGIEGEYSRIWKS